MSEYGTTVEDTYNGTLDPIDNATIAMNNAKLALSTLATTAQTAQRRPVIEKVTTKIQELTKWFTSLDEGQQQTIIKVGLVVAVVGPLAIGFGKSSTGNIDDGENRSTVCIVCRRNHRKDNSQDSSNRKAGTAERHSRGS